MQEDNKRLLKKINKAIGRNATDESTANFFGSLSLEEFDLLVEIFENNKFPDRQENLRQGLLIFIKKLRDKLMQETGKQ